MVVNQHLIQNPLETALALPYLSYKFVLTVEDTHCLLWHCVVCISLAHATSCKFCDRYSFCHSVLSGEQTAFVVMPIFISHFFLVGDQVCIYIYSLFRSAGLQPICRFHCFISNIVAEQVASWVHFSVSFLMPSRLLFCAIY